MTKFALKGPARPEAPHRADGVRDRARRRDGQRHVRPHGLDRQGVRLDLHRVARRLDGRDHRQVGLRHLGGTGDSNPLLDESLLAKVRQVPGVAAAEGASTARRRSSGRTARRSSTAARPTSASRSPTATPSSTRSRSSTGEWPGSGEVAIDEATADKENFDARPGGRRSGRRAGRASPHLRRSSGSDRSRRSAAPRSPASTCRWRNGSSTRQGKLDEIAVAAAPGVPRRSSSRRSRRSCRRPPRSSSPPSRRRRTPRTRTSSSPSSRASCSPSRASRSSSAAS